MSLFRLRSEDFCDYNNGEADCQFFKEHHTLKQSCRLSLTPIICSRIAQLMEELLPTNILKLIFGLTVFWTLRVCGSLFPQPLQVIDNSVVWPPLYLRYMLWRYPHIRPGPPIVCRTHRPGTPTLRYSARIAEIARRRAQAASDTQNEAHR